MWRFWRDLIGGNQERISFCLIVCIRALLGKPTYGVIDGLDDLTYEYFTTPCVNNVVLHPECITGMYCGHCGEGERIVTKNDGTI